MQKSLSGARVKLSKLAKKAIERKTSQHWFDSCDTTPRGKEVLKRLVVVGEAVNVKCGAKINTNVNNPRGVVFKGFCMEQTTAIDLLCIFLVPFLNCLP